MEESTKKIRIACVGDSITFGYGIKEKEQYSYPAQLQNLLGEKYEIGNFGTNHATVFKNGSKLYWNMVSFQKAKTFSPSIVIIIFGANCSNKTNWKNQENYESNILGLIQEFQNLTTSPEIIVCLPPPAFHKKFGVRPLIIENEIIPKLQIVIAQNNLTTIDLHTPLKKNKDFFTDAIHPDRNGAKIIADTIYNYVRNTTLSRI